MKQIYNKELEQQAMENAVIRLNDLRSSQQKRDNSKLRVSSKLRCIPFFPNYISIIPISPWRMNGKPIRKNSIKAGIITEVR